MKRNEKIALILNIILVILFFIGLFSAIKENINIIEYYTEDSNILSAISSIIFVVFLLIKKDIKHIPNWVCVLRFIGTTCLTLTFIVVVTILVPLDTNSLKDGYVRFLLQGSMLYHHFLCPVISFISFSIFEANKNLNKKKYIWYALIPTFIYGLIFIILNILKVVNGPYPFLRVYNQSVFVSLIWIVVIFSVNYLMAQLILYLNQLRANRD